LKLHTGYLTGNKNKLIVQNIYHPEPVGGEAGEYAM
jgi:hypothetical protein